MELVNLTNHATNASFTWSLNGERRHLTASQRAALAVELLPHLEEEAQKRKTSGINQYSHVPEIAHGSKGRARNHAASVTGVSPSYVGDAKRIKKENPEAFEKIRRGEATVAGVMRGSSSNRNNASAATRNAAQAMNLDAERKAAEIRIQAERKCGQLLKRKTKAKGGNPTGSNQHRKRNRSSDTTASSETTLNKLGISKDQSSRFQKLAEVPDDESEESLNCPLTSPSEE